MAKFVCTNCNKFHDKKTICCARNVTPVRNGDFTNASTGGFKTYLTNWDKVKTIDDIKTLLKATGEFTKIIDTGSDLSKSLLKFTDKDD